MNKKITLWLVVVAALVVAGVALWVGKTSQKYPGSLQKVSLQLKWLHQAQFAGFYVAAQKGFYKEEGLDVSISPVGEDLSSMKVIERVVNREFQFGVTGANQIIAARATKLPVKAVAVIYQQSPVALVGLQKTGIKKLADLIGKSTGVWRGQDTEAVYGAMLKNAGIDSARIKEVNISSSVEPLISGRVDTQMVYLINEGLEIRERGYALNTIYPEDYGVQFYGDALVTTDAMIEQNPDLVARFVRASLRGWNWAVEHPDQAAMFSLRYNSALNASHQTNMMQSSLPFIYTSKTDIGGMDAKTWNAMENILLREGLIKSRIPVEDLFTTKFLQS